VPIVTLPGPDAVAVASLDPVEPGQLGAGAGVDVDVHLARHLVGAEALHHDLVREAGLLAARGVDDQLALRRVLAR